jgi:hypothetical protein
MFTINNSEDALNLISAKSSGGADQWWSWGTRAADNSFSINPSTILSSNTGLKLTPNGALQWNTGTPIGYDEGIRVASDPVNSNSILFRSFIFPLFQT